MQRGVWKVSGKRVVVAVVGSRAADGYSVAADLHWSQSGACGVIQTAKQIEGETGQVRDKAVVWERTVADEELDGSAARKGEAGTGQK